MSNINQLIKMLVPDFFHKHLISVKSHFIDPVVKKKLAKDMANKHAVMLEKLKNKEKIKVVFLVTFESIWKLDQVFEKMLDDPYFEPLILVCPYTVFDEQRMWEEMDRTIGYFKEKNYPMFSAYNENEKRWISLQELAPDLVFFTNPHKLTRDEYYQDAYLNYLSCYAGYGMPVSKYSNYQEQFNQKFHNAMWNIFVQTSEMVENYKKFSMRKNNNIFLVGDCLVEKIRDAELSKPVWKVKNDKMKKLIWAPHHTISSNGGDFKIGTFLENFQIFREQAIKTKDSIHWAFKPHPILKSRLYEHPDWGVEKTDEYYSFWELSENTQYENGEYVDLFKDSDGLILDCSSFLGEYIFTLKPILYLRNEYTDSSMSDFGAQCLQSSYILNYPFNVEEFLNNILLGIDPKKDKRYQVVKQFDEQVGSLTTTTSDLILNILVKGFKGA